MKSEQLDQGSAAENCAESGLLRALLGTGLCGTGGREWAQGSSSGVPDVSLNLGKMWKSTGTMPQQSQCSHSWHSGRSLWQLHSALKGLCFNNSQIPSPAGQLVCPELELLSRAAFSEELHSSCSVEKGLGF